MTLEGGKPICNSGQVFIIEKWYFIVDYDKSDFS